MKINIEVQSICREKKRGDSFYTYNIVNELIKNTKNIYTLSIFDYNNERDNIRYIKELFEEKLDYDLVKTCNSVSYREINELNTTGQRGLYQNYTYTELFDINPDILFFPYYLEVPRNLDRPTVVMVHDLMCKKANISSFFNSNFISRVNHIMDYLVEKEDVVYLVDSNSTKQDLMMIYGVNENNIVVTHLACDKEMFFPDDDQSVRERFGICKPYLMYLGGVEERKGIVTLIKAFNLLEDDVQLVVSGKVGCKEELLTALQEPVDCSNIIITDYISNEEKRKLLSGASAFILPSFYEGFGLPILEAMACGTPVIAANNSSMPEVGGDAAIYFETGNERELKKAICSLLGNRQLQEEYIKRGFERCKSFSWEKTATETVRAFKLAAQLGDK